VDNPFFAQLVAQELDRIAEAKKKEKTKRTGEQHAIGFFAAILNTVMTAIVFCVLWHWFVVPKFHAPEFRWLEMVGFVLTVRAIVLPISFGRILRDPITWGQEISMELALPPFVLLIGWVIHLLMLRGDI
jgi:hypothetical protein